MEKIQQLEPYNLKEIVITIPARNEEKTILKTLESIKTQEPVDKEFLVIVFCNGCSDDTVNLCNQFKSTNPTFPIEILISNEDFINNVGIARKILMDYASNKIKGSGWIIMTDADTVFHSSWLAAYNELLETNFDLICGVIIPQTDNLSTLQLKYIKLTRTYLEYVAKLQRELYAIDIEGGPDHSHNSGPNMAIRGKVYKKIGGIPPLACLEDIALYNRVLESGLRIKHSHSPISFTSARINSRVRGGFGDELRNVENCISKKVEGVQGLISKFEAMSEIKDRYQKRDYYDLEALSSKLCISSAKLKDLFSTYKTYQGINLQIDRYLQSNKDWNYKYPKIQLEEAIGQFDNYYRFSQTTISYNSERYIDRNL